MDPISAHQFALEVQGVTEATFREASGFGSEHSIIEQKEQGPKGNTVVRKIPGTLKWQNITLKRGMTTNTELWKWRQQVIDGKIEDARLDLQLPARLAQQMGILGNECEWERSGDRNDRDRP
jgi:phage tail-like protein